MQVKQPTSWHDLKCRYFHNMMTLKSSITVAQNSILEMNKIYSEVIKKAGKTNPNTMKMFVNSWIKKINMDYMKEFPSMKEEHKKILDEPSKKNLQDFGFNMQQRLYNNAIVRLDTYQNSMNAFYDTWEEIWPEKSTQ
ncbi:MAG: hypothetical protein K5798_02400 [Nitrosopumilus sp.]|uniref:hypothetical protein n=1 Tax=Nitrosopumilus sp. TaxID=2024843 RepID=UPI00242E84C5|nr:hypothetical protein [Nitrosopumilus sp.]MCV0366100.1 hypothetical protein [Nitrosopumilus sp.]